MRVCCKSLWEKNFVSLHEYIIWNVLLHGMKNYSVKKVNTFFTVPIKCFGVVFSLYLLFSFVYFWSTMDTQQLQIRIHNSTAKNSLEMKSK